MNRALFVFYLGLVSLFVLLTSCSPTYVIRAAWEESKILLAREDISELLKNPNLSPDEREKLETIVSAREFTHRMGLDPGESFTQYSKVDRDVLAWVLVASKPDSFSLYSWWFPIVGWVPYKGYFEEDQANCSAKRLEFEGYETSVRGTEAISTLGWFNDPVLSTTLKHHPVRIANTVIHETLHATIWLPNYVEFNESLANFVGHQGSIDYFTHMRRSCAADNSVCNTKYAEYETLARMGLESELELHSAVAKLVAELKDLYNSSLTREEKLIHRVEIFEANMATWRKRYPDAKIFQKINNAEIMQLKIYLRDLHLFQDIYRRSHGDWPTFIGKIQHMLEKHSSADDPFDLLERGRYPFH